jgi:RecJ-like exonuclease
MICSRCEGQGGITYRHDPSPAGVGLRSGTLEDWDECPQCGGMGMVEPFIPCPFCGGDDLAVKSHGVECKDCGARGPSGDDVIRKWEER